jgi:DNA modification methylase
MGSAAKFFYCAKTSRTEKDIGLAVKGNPAKSVKPAAVNEWISNLVLPRGGALLDPFMGTGSTGMGAMAVPGSTFVGIDQKQSMVDIAAKRLAAWGAERHT